MYESDGRSGAQRLALALIHLCAIVIVYWLLFAGGIAAVSRLTGVSWSEGDFARRALIAAFSTVYFLRVLLTIFVFLHRGITWAEVATVTAWMWILHVSFALLGGANPQPLGAGAVAAVILYAAGSFLNTASEYWRDLWKRDPAHRGRLYTGGLFRYAMHINYLGDVLLFTGFAIATGRWAAGVFPVMMLAGFIFVNIPALDRHLKSRYGQEFDEYAARTKKLVPWIY